MSPYNKKKLDLLRIKLDRLDNDLLKLITYCLLPRASPLESDRLLDPPLPLRTDELPERDLPLPRYPPPRPPLLYGHSIFL